METIRVRRRGTIYVDDYYDVDEITEETIKKCIEDSDYQIFSYSEPDWQSFEEDGVYHVYDDDDNLLAKHEDN